MMEDTSAEVFAQRSMFNVIDTNYGWKVDLILKRTRPFSQVEFDRRVTIEYQARQIGDVAALLRVQGDTLDRSYLDHWVSELGLRAQFRQALELAEAS